MVTLLLHRQEASAVRWSKNDHETGRTDVREVKKQLAGSKKQLPANKKRFAASKDNLPQDQKRLHIHGVM